MIPLQNFPSESKVFSITAISVIPLPYFKGLELELMAEIRMVVDCHLIPEF
jgi:hypothetical protein